MIELARAAACGPRRARLGTAITAALLAVAGCGDDPGASGACGARTWVSAWQAAPTDALLPIDASLNWLRAGADQSYRVMLTPLGDGSAARVHVSNRFGRGTMRLAAVRLARRGDGAGVVAGTSVTLTFGGDRSVTLAPGSEAVSDPAEFRVTAFEVLAISVHALDAGGVPTHHLTGRQRSYATAPGAGDHTEDLAADAFTQTTTSRPIVAALDVLAPAGSAALVTLGDSLTDGFQAGPLGIPETQATVDTDQRYPDFLRRRLGTSARRLAVSNAGISGNRLLTNGLPPFGRSALERLDADVVERAGVTDVLLFEGINDIGQASASASALIDGYRAVVERLHARGLHVIHATLTPAGRSWMPGYSGESGRATRNAVNQWIRAESPADAIVDFDAAVRDTADPEVIDARFDGGDGLHLNPDGYARLADTIDLSRLRGADCPPAGSAD